MHSEKNDSQIGHGIIAACY